MATLDQLPAEQRAIVELVVQRGRSYDALADVLQVPVERVRELARDALTELSPRTASRVDPEWRGQIADYLLGQQPADGARSTRDYLKRTESARAWALSLLDSLDPLYPDGAQPAVPEPGGEPLGAVREAEPVAAAPEVEEEKPQRETAEDRVRARERARKKRAEAEEEGAAAALPEPERKPARKPGALSPEAQAALTRRRAIGGGVAAVLLVVLILAIAGVFSGGDDGGSKTTASTTPTGTSTTPGQAPIQVLGQIPLAPIGKTSAQGVAYVVQQGKQRFLVVQAQVPPLPNTQKVAAYEVWLYNSNNDARSLGAQYTNAKGVLQGRAPLPNDFAKFKAVDISRELFSDKNTAHGTSSILRGTFASLKPVPEQQQGGATTTTPAP